MPKPHDLPNILYIHSHDTGRYIAPYGHAVSTPYLQAFAERGTVFRRAFCANPTCSPSRACLLTGQYAHTNGMMGLAHRGAGLHHPQQTLPAWLATQGYRTVLAGFQHITGHGAAATARVGYQDDLTAGHPPLVGNADGYDRAVVNAARHFLNQTGVAEGAGHSRTPFFLDVGFFTTHRTPTQPGQEQWHNDGDSPAGDPRYVTLPPCLPDGPATRADYADFLHAATRLDGYIGSVLDALDRAGLCDNTLVIITTDHGIAFPLMKGCLTAHGTGVLLMTSGPGFGSDGGGGRVVDSLVSQVDLFPTLCDVLGCEAPDWLEGESFRRVYYGDDGPRDAVYAEMNYHAAYDPMRSVRTDAYSYVRRLDPADHPVLANIDDSATKTALHASRVLAGPCPAEQLFDLKKDPTEAANVINLPEYASIAQQMRRRLDVWMKETMDPARSGKLRVSGMVVNERHAYSPNSPSAVETEPG